MFGPDGALAGTHAGSVIIDMSTVSPDASRRLFQAARERRPDDRCCRLGKCATSGTGQPGDLRRRGAQDLSAVQTHPGHSGTNSFYMGLSGMGTTMKLVVNTLLGLGMQALAEAIALGEKAGVEKGLLLDVLGQTTVLTPGQKSKLENVRREEYPTNFALSLMHKDFSLVLSQAYDLAVSMPATAAAQQMYTAAMAKGRDADFSIMIQFMEELAGVSNEEHLSNH